MRTPRTLAIAVAATISGFIAVGALAGYPTDSHHADVTNSAVVATNPTDDSPPEPGNDPWA